MNILESKNIQISTDIPMNSPTIQNTHNPYNVNLTQENLALIKHYINWERGSWTVNDQNLLKDKIKNCQIRKECHWEMSRKCAKKAKIIDFPKLIISSILSSSLTFNAKSNNDILYWINVCLSIILTFLTSLSVILKYGVEESRHRSSSIGFEKLALQIDRDLRLNPEHRSTFGDTLAKINEQYSQLKRDSPLIYSYLYNQIKNYHLNKIHYNSENNIQHNNNTQDKNILLNTFIKKYIKKKFNNILLNCNHKFVNKIITTNQDNNEDSNKDNNEDNNEDSNEDSNEDNNENNNKDNNKDNNEDNNENSNENNNKDNNEENNEDNNENNNEDNNEENNEENSENN